MRGEGGGRKGGEGGVADLTVDGSQVGSVWVNVDPENGNIRLRNLPGNQERLNFPRNEKFHKKKKQENDFLKNTCEYEEVITTTHNCVVEKKSEKI